MPAAGADVVPGRRLVPEPEHVQRSTSRFPDMSPVGDPRMPRLTFQRDDGAITIGPAAPRAAAAPSRIGPAVRDNRVLHGLRTDPHSVRDLLLVTPGTKATSPVEVARGPPCVR